MGYVTHQQQALLLYNEPIRPWLWGTLFLCSRHLCYYITPSIFLFYFRLLQLADAALLCCALTYTLLSRRIRFSLLYLLRDPRGNALSQLYSFSSKWFAEYTSPMTEVLKEHCKIAANDIEVLRLSVILCCMFLGGR